jgi:hypothetical protein
MDVAKKASSKLQTVGVEWGQGVGVGVRAGSLFEVDRQQVAGRGKTKKPK